MNIEELQKLNPHIKINEITDEAFRRYGRIISGYDFNDMIDWTQSNAPISDDGNIYVASEEKLESFAVVKKVEQELYGDMPVEVGYCTGKNSTLNGLEYHKGSEINIATTDIVLLLGSVQDIVDNNYESKRVEAFFIPKNSTIEVYATTLHFGPCKVLESGFKVIVILPDGTNQPLDDFERDKGGEVRLLFMKNKWLIAHPLRKPLIDKGAYPGIVGDNTEIFIK